MSMKQNADHIHMQARKYVQILWSEKLVAITPDTILSTARYIQNILPVRPSFYFILFYFFWFRQLSRSILSNQQPLFSSRFFNEELLDFNQFNERHYTQSNH